MVKETIGQREARQILECLKHDLSEKDRMYEAVRKGEIRGRIDSDGSVTVLVGGISSVKYSSNGGSVTYGF